MHKINKETEVVTLTILFAACWLMKGLIPLANFRAPLCESSFLTTDSHDHICFNQLKSSPIVLRTIFPLQ